MPTAVNLADVNMPLIGAQFPSIEDLKDSINQWIISKHVSYKVKRAESNRYKLRCKAGVACPFQLDAFPRGQYRQNRGF